LIDEIFHRGRVPMILQSEASECGLACLAMIATKHGRRTTLFELRAKFSLSLKGMTLQHVIQSADALGFSCRPLRCELEELDQISLPAIIHWDLNHFVVLTGVGRRGLEIHDPSKGRRTIALKVASKHFTGVALELMPAPLFAKKETVDRLNIEDLWTRIRGLAAGLWQLFALAVLLQIFALAAPLVNQIIVDEAITKGDLSLLTTVILGFVILMLVQTIIGTLRSFVGMYLGNLLTFQMQSNLLRHLLRLPADFFEKRHVGDILSRFGSLGPIQNLLTSGVIGAGLDGLMAIGTLAFMLFYAPTLTLVVVGFLIAFFAIRLITFPFLRRLSEEQIQTSADLQSYFLETIRSVRPVKLFGREEQRHSRWQNLFADNMNVGIRLARFGIWAGVGTGLMGGAQNLIILYLGARSVISGDMTLGMLFAFQAYRASFSGSAMGLVNTFISWRLVGLHLERLSDIARTEVEEPDKKPSKLVTQLRGEIEVEGLRFRYGDNEPWVLDNLSFKVRAGERLAIVGRSGGGKSTLMKLMLGLYPLEEGRVLYDGKPLDHLGRRALRSQVGVVMQDDRLLSGSLAENIGFFDTEIDMERVMACAKAAAMHNEIEAMPMGYQSLVGDMGSALSGGQIQRLLLARALYPEPAILMLDEGTANLDAESEHQIVESLAKLPITQIIIAHREQAIASSDRVMRLEQGQLLETPHAHDCSRVEESSSV
jgi:ATP-binding cassette subfamily B protein RaxB